MNIYIFCFEASGLHQYQRYYLQFICCSNYKNYALSLDFSSCTLVCTATLLETFQPYYQLYSSSSHLFLILFLVVHRACCSSCKHFRLFYSMSCKIRSKSPFLLNCSIPRIQYNWKYTALSTANLEVRHSYFRFPQLLIANPSFSQIMSPFSVSGLKLSAHRPYLAQTALRRSWHCLFAQYRL